MKTLNDLLNKLPLNGKKTVTGVVVTLLLWQFPDIPLTTETLDKVIECFGYIYLVVGPIHKWIKAKIRARV